ncbi:MAG: hypothetical protein PHV16_00865 [Candidatus Nanoarchaeia archaeon]|nr:hypothetical protein [Candidatus Nanoarchaeia archaeon]
MEKNNVILVCFTFILLVLIFAMVISAPAYTGRVIDVNNLDDALNQVNELKDEYNLKSNTFPSFIARIFGNEVVNIEITRRNSSVENIDMKTVNGKIIKLNNITEPFTLKITTDEDTFDEVLNSDDQIRAFKKALDKRKIRYQSMRFRTTMKMGTVRTVLAIRSFFR